ncbi:MAG: DUF2953 domain-containing protein [Methanoculleus sp.]|jgi:hypothetical protein|uniref:DUF2953 domain-containing protein n=1 Tax=Methanoculleus palmolei TaxID=72612 RepID=A0ABD8AAC3_9EURY|nr:DUF2953 domain-containing protein [Methanoculleus sp.]WOX56484.1 DUF2953 domain-containing protein [Methanoculleus palmolei]
MVAAILFSILLVVAAVILALLLALYLVPVIVEAAADCTRERARATAIVAWGIVGARVRVDDAVQVLEVLVAGRRVMTRDLRAIAATEPEKEEKTAEKQGPARPVRDYLGAAGDLWPHIRKVLAAVDRSLYLETLRGDVTLGLDSPADTGVVYGYYTAARYALWPAEAIDFVLTPVFDRRVFEGALTLRMQVRRPLLIIIPVVQALLQKPVRERLRQVPGRGAPGA